jgi:archaellum component FlaG (FlaF/FlaG flagellin family)
MPITHVKQEGKDVRIYENNRIRLSVKGTLMGYTNTTVTIKEGSNTMLYEEVGNMFRKRTI